MIEIDLKLMQCGNCGNEMLHIYQGDNRLILECTKCRSTSKVNIVPARLEVGWPDQDSKGIFTVFKKGSEKKT